MKEETHEWLQIADGDLRAARGLIDLELPSHVAFHCQQAIEKLLKALIIENSESAPRVHDLVELADLIELELAEEQQLLLARLSYQAVASRYPGPTLRYTEEDKVQELLEQTERFFAWLQAKLT